MKLPDLCASSMDRFDLWGRIARAWSVSRMAEVGVWRGSFAARMLGEVHCLSEYLLIDPWRPLPTWNKPLNGDAEHFEEAMRSALADTAFAGSKVKVLRGTTAEVEGQIPDQSLDLIYVDGDHTLRGIAIDLIRMMPKLRPGAILGGDDYFEDPWHHGASYEPTLVCPFANYFAEAMRLPFFALPHRQFAIVNEPIGFSFTNLSGVACRDRVGMPEERGLRTRSWLQRVIGLR